MNLRLLSLVALSAGFLSVTNTQAGTHVEYVNPYGTEISVFSNTNPKNFKIEGVRTGKAVTGWKGEDCDWDSYGCSGKTAITEPAVLINVSYETDDADADSYSDHGSKYEIQLKLPINRINNDLLAKIKAVSGMSKSKERRQLANELFAVEKTTKVVQKKMVDADASDICDWDSYSCDSDDNRYVYKTVDVSLTTFKLVQK